MEKENRLIRKQKGSKLKTERERERESDSKMLEDEEEGKTRGR